jgi:hypothetical protein
MTEAAGLRDGADLVDDDGFHLHHSSPPWTEAGDQLRPARV